MIWRVEPTLFLIWFTELTFGKMSQIFEPFLNMTQRIEQLFSNDSNIWALFYNWLTELIFFLKKLEENDSQDWTFFCWKYDSKNWTFFLLNLTQRIVPSFFSWLQYLDLFSHDSNHWTFFFYVTQILDWTFWKFLIQRNGPLFFSGLKVFSSRKNNSQNWIFLNSTHRIDFFFVNWTIKFLEYDAKNVTV